MPISQSSKKSLRKSIKNRKSNVTLKNKLKTVLKAFLAKPNEEALQKAHSMLDKAKKRGLIHENKVARVKSQLSKKVGGEAVIKAKVVKKATKKTAVKRTAKAKMSK